ncbi:hypothetical protein [Streptomyces albireticuli]|uniref:hypothetical protein n=1 Tax=Streptomyces albireticuli TaxID=1940 RepID=UPI0030B8CA3E
MVLTDTVGRLLFCGETRPGSCPDTSQAGESGIIDLLGTGPWVGVLADVGTRDSAPRPGARSSPRHIASSERTRRLGTRRRT